MSSGLLQRIQGFSKRFHVQDSDDLRLPFVFSIVLHLAVVLVFSLSDLMKSEPVLVKPKELKYIKTVVVSRDGSIAKKQQEATKKVEDDRVKQIRRQEQAQKQIEQQERIAAKKAKLEKEKKEKEAAEQKKREEQKKQDLLAKQKAEQEAREKERLKKEQEQQEQERQKALMKQRQEREEQLRKMREARQQQEALREKREALEKQRQAELAQQDAPILSEYESHIQSKVSQNWSRPLSARNGMQVILQINLMPGGDVANVQVIESSENEAFDDSAMQAVWKASPLPVPDEAGVFTRNYRVFNLLFAPEDLWE